FFFFFSSRRRHTRSLRDWSSDVCSSDLAMFTRRNFLRSVGTATAMAGLASFSEGGIERIIAATRSTGDASPDKLATDEDFWRERSEERRVGKECRCGWWPSHEKRKKRKQ